MVSYPTADGGRRPLPVRRAAGAGAAAIVLGYLVTLALVLLEGGLEHSHTLSRAEGALAFPRSVALVFFEAQFVTTGLRIGAHDGSAQLLPEVAETVHPYAYHLAPGVGIAVAAALFVNAVPFRPASPETGAALGAALVVGYLPLAVVGIAVATVTVTGSTVAGPDVVAFPELTRRAVFPAIVYPTTFGMVGGAIACRGGERAPEEQ